jgi:hypothetical protein
MPRLAPRIGVLLLVTLLFGPLTASAEDADDKRAWAVVVAGQITWTGEEHRECVERATAAGGQCVALQHQKGASTQYCPEVTPGTAVRCYSSDGNHDHDRDHDRDR